MFIGTTLDGVLLDALQRRTQMGFTKSAIIKEALRQYLKPEEGSA